MSRQPRPDHSSSIRSFAFTASTASNYPLSIITTDEADSDDHLRRQLQSYEQLGNSSSRQATNPLTLQTFLFRQQSTRPYDQRREGNTSQQNQLVDAQSVRSAQTQWPTANQQPPQQYDRQGEGSTASEQNPSTGLQPLHSAQTLLLTNDQQAGASVSSQQTSLDDNQSLYSESTLKNEALDAYADLTYLGERHWESHPSGGQRQSLKAARGVIKSLGPGGGREWREAIQVITSYVFNNPDLLEEALESPGSGVLVVGTRMLKNGNRDLAILGEKVMKMLLAEQFYYFQVNPGDMAKYEERLIGRTNLCNLGVNSKIERFIRPRLSAMQERPTRKWNPIVMLKDDVKSEARERVIARAIKAIIGAVYFDGGTDAARRVMHELKITLTA